LSRGEIGEAFFIRCRYGHGGRPGYERDWRLRRDVAGGGEVLDQGIHALDLFRWFLGDFDVAVGFLSTYFWRAAADAQEADQVEDNGFGLFRTSRAQVASLHVSWTQWKNIFSFEVFGRDGSLTVDGLGGSYGAERLTRARRRPAGGPPQEQVTAFHGPDPSWEREWDAFVTAVREERCPEGNGYDGLEALKMVQALYEAHRKGTVVRISSGA
jgi:predicted dehydrogenase